MQKGFTIISQGSIDAKVSCVSKQIDRQSKLTRCHATLPFLGEATEQARLMLPNETTVSRPLVSHEPASLRASS
jgi:hypothetical protein